MKYMILALTISAACFQAFAQGPSLSEADFCSDRKDPEFVKDLTHDSANLMSFQNQGGMLGGGVCWWHSRFQRNALYLTIYQPELDRPTDTQARHIITQIKQGNRVVVIPGFNNFSEFSYEYAQEIQNELNLWQKIDGIAKFAWIKGLRGSAVLSPEKLKKDMDKIYEDVEINKNISYNKLQIPGIEAHAWLVVHMEKVPGGYDLEILDSNNPSQTENYSYREGDTDFRYSLANFNFVPYLDQTGEMKRLKSAISHFCK
jgi:hypothetical protein